MADPEIEQQDGYTPDEPAPDAPPEPEREPESDEEGEAQQAELPLEEDASQPSAPEPESRADKERQKKLARAVSNYVRAVGAALDDDVNEILPCPLCGGTVWPGFVHVADAGHVPPDVIDATRLFLGFAREQDYEPDPEVAQCATCKGKGQTKTGSSVGNYMTRTCPACKGHGYTPPPGAGLAGQGAALALANGAGEPPEQIGDPDVDIWGDPRVLPDGTLNDNYGKMPQYKHPHPVYGDTKNLTAQAGAQS